MHTEFIIATWLPITCVSLLGGITRYLFNRTNWKEEFPVCKLITYLFSSVFISVLIGSLCLDFNFSTLKTIFLCGLSSFYLNHFFEKKTLH